MMKSLLALGFVLCASPAFAQSGIGFAAPTTHARSVTGYRVNVEGPTPQVLNIGKPDPDVNNLITVIIPDFFATLEPGDYKMTITAIGPGGATTSRPTAFTVTASRVPAPGPPTIVP